MQVIKGLFKENLERMAGFSRVQSRRVCLVGVQHIDHTFWGALCQPTPQGCWAQQLENIPESYVRRMHKATLRIPSKIIKD